MKIGGSKMGSVSNGYETVSSAAAHEEPSGSLGDQKLLAKIDKLRELGVSTLVPLPQLVVVGDQSSGKSSVLESLTGFSFPRDVGLCTRYATQITCCRDAQKSIAVSIIPAPDSDPFRKERLREFSNELDGDISMKNLAEIFERANDIMGIRPADMGLDEDDDDGFTTFSEDILKIEVSGPDQVHLTIIDVPGIFRTATPGVTTEDDIALVRNMVKSYMKDPRTIILAVMPSNVDIATQEVLTLAKEADPEGIRTMGVLTKPDLAAEQAMRRCIHELILGKRNDLKLGYCVVKNRGADDRDSTLAQRHRAERDFFRREDWAPIKGTGRTGVEALKQRLSELLVAITRREFPHVKAEIARRLHKRNDELERMGPSRGDAASQRLYLTRLATQFQTVTGYALNGFYTEDEVFSRNADMKLITRVRALNEAFAAVFARKGHTRHFAAAKGEGEGGGNEKGGKGGVEDGVDGEPGALGPEQVNFEIPVDEYPELHDIIVSEPYDCPVPSEEPIMDHIREVVNSSRGPELGTFGGALLGTTFREQTHKWEPLTLWHVSGAVALVHHFVAALLRECCPEPAVRDQLWDTVLAEALRAGYARALDHARFLLDLERGAGRPVTVDHEFDAAVRRRRVARLSAAFAQVNVCISSTTSSPDSGGHGSDAAPEGHHAHAPIRAHQTLMLGALDKGSPQQVCEDMHDVLRSYYGVARRRFVDVVCQQVVHYYLLGPRPDGPLRILGPDRIAALDDGQLDAIAGEDSASRRQRQLLGDEIKRLVAAVQVLRG